MATRVVRLGRFRVILFHTDSLHIRLRFPTCFPCLVHQRGNGLEDDLQVKQRALGSGVANIQVNHLFESRSVLSTYLPEAG